MAKPYVNTIFSVPGNAANDAIFHGAMFQSSMFQSTKFQGAIVNANGDEKLITEQMIQDACTALEQEANSIYTSEITGTINASWQTPDLANF